MVSAPERSVFDVISDFIVSMPTAEAIIAYQLPRDIQERAHYLLERNRQGTLTKDEAAEMRKFILIDDLMTLLKAKVRLKQAKK